MYNFGYVKITDKNKFRLKKGGVIHFEYDGDYIRLDSDYCEGGGYCVTDLHLNDEDEFVESGTAYFIDTYDLLGGYIRDEYIYTVEELDCMGEEEEV